MRISDWSSDVCSSDLDSTLTRPDGTVIEGIRDGNRLSSVPKFQMAANATYSFPIDAAGDTNAFVTASLARQSVVSGKSVPERVDLGGRRLIKKQKITVRINSCNNR